MTTGTRKTDSALLGPDEQLQSMLAEPQTLSRSERRQRTALLWQNRKQLGTVVFAAVVIAFLLALLIPNWYEATCRLMPPDQKGSSGALSMLMASSGGGGGGGGVILGDLLGIKGQSTGDLMLEVLRSRTVKDRIIERFNLKAVYGQRLSQDARDVLSSNTKLTVDQKSGVMKIAVTDRDPARAKGIAGAYVEELNRAVADLDTSAAHRERMFLEQRLALVKQEMEAANTELAKFSSQNRTIDPKEQGKAMVDAASRLQGELIAAEAQLNGLQQIYTDQNIKVRSARAQVAGLKRELEKLRGAQAGKAEDGDYPSLSTLPQLGATYADLYRRSRIEETVYEVLTKQYELAKVEEAKELPSVRLLDPPEIPERKAGPHRLLIALGVAFFCLCFNAIWIIAVDRVERMDADDPARPEAEAMIARVREIKRRALDRGPVKFVTSKLARFGANGSKPPSVSNS